jgi:hypothetical protein
MVLRIKRHLSPYPRLKSVKNDQQNLEGGLYTCIVHFESHWIDIITELIPDQKGHSYVFWLKENVRIFLRAMTPSWSAHGTLYLCLAYEKLPCALQDGVI